MFTKENCKLDENNRQAGFSLLEMVVAILIFTMVSASIFGLMELGREDRNKTSRRGDIQKNARLALYLIGRDVMNAGLGYHKTGGIVPDDFLQNRLGVAADIGSGTDTLTSVACGNNVFANKYLPSTQKTDSIAFLYRDLDYNGGKPVVVSDEKGGTGATAIVLQLPTPTPTPVPAPSKPGFSAATNFASVNNNDLFIAETKTSQIIGMVTSKDAANYRISVDKIDNLGLNKDRNLLDGSNKPIGSVLRACVNNLDQNCTTYTAGVGGGIVLKKVEMVSYQVSNDGTLLRTIYGNNKDNPANDQIQQRAIAYGVQNFQIQYQMVDGKIVDDPVVGADGIRGTSDDTPSQMNNVRYVSLSITVSSTELDENGKPEILSLSSTFSLRNMTYDDK